MNDFDEDMIKLGELLSDFRFGNARSPNAHPCCRCVQLTPDGHSKKKNKPDIYIQPSTTPDATGSPTFPFPAKVSLAPKIRVSDREKQMRVRTNR